MKVTKIILNLGTYDGRIELTQEMIDKMKPGDWVEAGIDEDPYVGYQLCDCHTAEDLSYFRLYRYGEETDEEKEKRKAKWKIMLAEKKEERRKKYESLKKEFEIK